VGLRNIKALWVHGWNRVDPATKASDYNENEFDIDIQWRVKEGLLKGFWPRFRYARVDQHGGGAGSVMNDVRAIVNCEINVLLS